MDLDKILSAINSKQKNTVIVRWNDSPIVLNVPLSIKKECWRVTLTNDPEKYFDNLDIKFKKTAHHSHKFKINNINEGIDIYKKLYLQLNNESVTEDPNTGDIDFSKEIYLAIHIHYHT